MMFIEIHRFYYIYAETGIMRMGNHLSLRCYVRHFQKSSVKSHQTWIEEDR